MHDMRKKQKMRIVLTGRVVILAAVFPAGYAQAECPQGDVYEG
jgi:hypothetical protein